jgi:carbon monoxide dehydrogenase subunit G
MDVRERRVANRGDIKGEYQIASNREKVWQALIDPETLKKCIPGCESMEQISDTEFAATVMAAIGPVRARFQTKLSLENLRPPESYTLVGESKAGAAGFGRGSADVTLADNDDGTLLSYTADFKVGGKLAQVGSRLVVGVTKKIADDFFGKFSRELDPGSASVAAEDSGHGTVASRTWLAVAGAVIVLLIWWFLLR